MCMMLIIMCLAITILGTKGNYERVRISSKEGGTVREASGLPTNLMAQTSRRATYNSYIIIAVESKSAYKSGCLLSYNYY